MSSDETHWYPTHVGEYFILDAPHGVTCDGKPVRMRTLMRVTECSAMTFHAESADSTWDDVGVDQIPPLVRIEDFRR